VALLAALLPGCVPAGTVDPAGALPTVGGAPGVGVTDDRARFPATAQEYAERTVAAWSAPDLFRLAELATDPVHTQLLELPGPPNRAWRSVACQAGPGDTDCTFHNAVGDVLVVTVDSDRLGTAQAVTAVRFDPVRFPDHPHGYVAELVAAWQAGNLARMRRLATPETVAALQALPVSDSVSYHDGPPRPGLATVVVTLPTARLLTTVDPDRLGAAQAVRTAGTLPD